MIEDAISIGGVDLTDPNSYLTGPPLDAFRKLRERAPVAWHPFQEGPGFLALTGYDEVVAVSRDSATWSSETDGVYFEAPGPDSPADMRGVMMLTMDPPRHTALRKLVNKGFTPRQVARLNERIAEMARDLVDNVIEQGECDFVQQVAGALPSYVISEMLGIPLEDGFRLYELTEITNAGQVQDARIAEAGMQIFAYAAELAARKRVEPGDDIATSLLNAEINGQGLTDMEFNFFFILLLNAGGDTTRNLVAGGMLALMENPAELAKLEKDTSMMSTAVEEMLRYISPVMWFLRTATRDTEVRGMPVEKGGRVAMFYPSANRDETKFPDPDTFDITRTPNPHVAFGGGGTHFCLGANLARVESSALLSEVLARMKNVELAGPVQRMQSMFINGIHSMPVRFTPAHRLGRR
ncbi:cytochrome P450 [Mycolicibacterium chubuense NBB4]|uniref:Steroid C26-monooxygenase n=1 Tax=Mycolicibacterium chubuense (strain NBB4) TaxID=710421 RepID=I4BNK9_MYCCN|nr:cytochrome P450 [Mycolicibacterium chubuense]AFM18866.1 cytochrome P450 [Mycolicibacterium chubuense NBB4]